MKQFRYRSSDDYVYLRQWFRRESSVKIFLLFCSSGYFAPGWGEEGAKIWWMLVPICAISQRTTVQRQEQLKVTSPNMQ